MKTFFSNAARSYCLPWASSFDAMDVSCIAWARCTWLSMSRRDDFIEKSSENGFTGFDESVSSLGLAGLLLFSDSMSLESVSLLLASSTIRLRRAVASASPVIRVLRCTPSTVWAKSEAGWAVADLVLGSLLTLVVKIRRVSLWAFITYELL